MASYRFHTADVFTDRAFGGNPLAVLPDARGLDAAEMRLVAREFHYSETVFVLPARDPAHARRLRIFTPAAEIPFAGHPIVGTAFVLAAAGEIRLEGDETRIVFEAGAGPVPVVIRSRGGRPVSAELTAPRNPEPGASVPPAESLVPVLGLRAGDFPAASAPRVFSCGVPFLFVRVAGDDAVRRARIADREAWARLASERGLTGVFVFTLAGGPDDFRVHARMFAPHLGVEEDPATGSAAAALAGVLAAGAPPGDARLRWTVEQGLEIGRPSRIAGEADLRDGSITAVRVGGASVLVSEGRIEVP